MLSVHIIEPKHQQSFDDNTFSFSLAQYCVLFVFGFSGRQCQHRAQSIVERKKRDTMLLVVS